MLEVVPVEVDRAFDVHHFASEFKVTGEHEYVVAPIIGHLQDVVLHSNPHRLVEALVAAFLEVTRRDVDFLDFVVFVTGYLEVLFTLINS